MEARWMRKVYKQGSSLVVVLPPSLAALLNVTRGDTVVLTSITGNEVVVTPLGRYVGSLPPELRDKGIIKL